MFTKVMFVPPCQTVFATVRLAVCGVSETLPPYAVTFVARSKPVASS